MEGRCKSLIKEYSILKDAVAFNLGHEICTVPNDNIIGKSFLSNTNSRRVIYLEQITPCSYKVTD